MTDAHHIGPRGEVHPEHLSWSDEQACERAQYVEWLEARQEGMHQ